MIKDLLLQLDFGKNDAEIYVQLHIGGRTTAGNLIKTTKLHRNIVYRALQTLEKKGLITRISHPKTTYFEANPPSALQHLVKQKEAIASQAARALESQSAIVHHQVSLYEGDVGFRAAFWDILEPDLDVKELLIMGIFAFDPTFREMISTFHQERAHKGIPSRILLNSGAELVGAVLEKLPSTDVRYMQKGMVTPAVFLIYANRVLLSLPNQRTFIRIVNAEANNAFKTYFETFWNLANTSA